MRPIIAVIGSSRLPSDLDEMVADFGQAVARQGWSLVCGGLGGAMAAACRGFRRGREALPPEDREALVAIGVLPGTEGSAANPFVDVAIPTGMSIARNLVVVRTADAVVAVRGGSGTLSEVAFAWQLHKPIVALASTGGWAARLANQTIDDRRTDTVMAAATVQEAIEKLRSALGSAGGQP